MSKVKSYNLVFAYYPHASSNANGLEFKGPLFKGDLEKLKARVESVVSKPPFLARINYLSRNMSTTFAEDHVGGWNYNRSIHFNPKTTKVTISGALQSRPDKAAFIICIKGSIHFKKLPNGNPLDDEFWKEWPKLFNTHAHGNNVIGVFKAAQRNSDRTWPKKGVAGEVKCLGFQDRCPDDLPASFRLVIGYYPQEPDFDPEDKRPAATKKTLEALLRKPKTWAEFHKLFYDQAIYDKKGDHYPARLGKIKPLHIKKIKVLSGPVHDPTVWEKITGKHDGWMYHPALVAVIDMQNIPLIKVKETPQKPMDGKFGDWVVAHHNHSALSGDGWINQFQTQKKDPFHGDLYLLQMGETILPNYRHFIRESF
jgi:hypothetical protein